MDPFIQQYHNKSVETHILDSVTEYKNKLYSSCDVGLKIFHINIRSLVKNFDELILFLGQFEEKFDVIALTETFKLHDISLFTIGGYNMLYSHSEVNRNDGVVVYVRDGLKYECETILFESIKILNFSFILGNTRFRITPIYRPHETCPIKFVDNLENFLRNNNNDYDCHIIIGDTNYDILSQKNNSLEYLNILSQNGYISYINEHTRVVGESKSCLDHVFMRIKYSQENIGSICPFVFKCQLTDHYPIMIHIPLKKYNKTTPEGKHEYKKFLDYRGLTNDLLKVDWKRFYSIEDLNIATDDLVRNINQSIKCNTKTVKIKSNKNNSWITSALLNSINTKNKLYRETVKHPDDINLIMKYKNYRNKLTNLIKYTKSRYYASQINKNRTSSGGMWQCVRSICGESGGRTNVICELKTKDGRQILNKVDIANEFNTYYTTLGEKWQQISKDLVIFPMTQI